MKASKRQGKTGAFVERSNLTKDSAFDLINMITGPKVVSELTREEKYYYLAKHYCPQDQNSLFKK